MKVTMDEISDQAVALATRKMRKKIIFLCLQAAWISFVTGLFIGFVFGTARMASDYEQRIGAMEILVDEHYYQNDTRETIGAGPLTKNDIQAQPGG